MATEKQTKSSKGRKKETSSTIEEKSQETQVVETVAAEVVAPVTTPVVKKAQEEQKFTLTDIAHRFVHNFNHNWMPGIIRYSKTQNFTEPATEQECKDLLKRWGAKLK